jgi:signal peptidase I
MSNKFVSRIILSLIFLSIIYFMPYRLVMVVGDSMYPTLKNGQIVLVKKVDVLKKGDIVVAKNPERDVIIKRIQYTPNTDYYYLLTENAEKYDLYDFIDKDLYNFLLKHSKYMRWLRCRVSEGQYYLVGDNHDNSEDSRIFGSIPEKDIMYKVIYK